MGLGLLDRFLKCTINKQIRVGITLIVLMAIIISISLLAMSNIIQYQNFSDYYEKIIYDEDNKMLLNYEQYIHTIENTIESKAKNDLEFYRILEKMYFENLEGLELNTLLDDNMKNGTIIESPENCYNNNYLNCINYKFYGDNTYNYENNENFMKMKNYYNLIFPLLNSTLSENCIGVFSLKHYHNFQFYKKLYENDEYKGNLLFFAGTKDTPFIESYEITKYRDTIKSNILDNLLNLFLVIPNFNKKFDTDYILSHFQEFSSIPQITSKHILGDNESVPYTIQKKEELVKIKENDLSFESKIFNFNPNIDTSLYNYFKPLLTHNISSEGFNELINNISQKFGEKMEDLMIIKWSDRFFENLVNDIFCKYKTILNIFSLLFSPYATIKEKILENNNYFFDDTNGISLTRDILEKFSCMYIIKKELVKTENNFEKLNSFNITTCEVTFNDDFEEYLKNNQTEIDIYERKKVKVDIIKYNIKYIYFNYYENGTKGNEERNINFDLSKREGEDNSKNSFKIFQGIYPSNSLNMISSFLYNNIMFINFYFTDLFTYNQDMKSIREVCYSYFFYIILSSNAGLWFICLALIIIIVFKISHSISDPIDKLIQPAPLSENSTRELNKYIQNISYQDDSTINDLFILCKKLFIGGFKSEEDYKQKKKNKMINSYNNISLVKSNNMIIDEAEIMKGVKKREINFFEEQNIKPTYFTKFAKDSVNKMKKLDYKVLSGPLFSGKFYQNNKTYLIKDKEMFDILNNEMISLKKKMFDDNRSKGTKHSIITNIKENNIS